MSLALVALILLSACSSSSDAPHGLAAGSLSVVSTHYPGPRGDPGYNTAIAFQVTNARDVVAFRVRYEVTVRGASAVLLRTRAERPLTIPARTTRLVVYTTNDVSGEEPVSAEVIFRPETDSFRPVELPDESMWQIDEIGFECSEVVPECDVVGRLTWTGGAAQSAIAVSVAIPVESEGGKVMAAGFGETEARMVEPGHSTRFRFLLIGLTPEQRSTAATHPTDVYVDSENAPSA